MTKKSCIQFLQANDPIIVVTTQSLYYRSINNKTNIYENKIFKTYLNKRKILHLACDGWWNKVGTSTQKKEGGFK